MNRITKRVLALLLCAALICGFAVIPQANAQQPQTNLKFDAASFGENVVYGKAGETTYVPAGYTYVYEDANGQVYAKRMGQSAYVSAQDLTPEEAEALASLEYGESHMVDASGQNLVCKEFDAQEAAAYSNAVKAILSGTEIHEGDKVSLLSQAHTSLTPVRAFITFEDAPVIRLEGMSVALGTALGAQELQAIESIQARQLSVMAKVEKRLGYDIEIENQFSLLTNAVAATVNYGDLAKISKMDGVKSAILMPSYEAPETYAEVVTSSLDFETNMQYAGSGMGANQAWDVGYKGEGLSVAVIDTGLSYMNPAFSIEPTDPNAVAYTRDDIANILSTHDLHAEILTADTSVDTVYYSSKIPFGFSYGDGIANFGEDTTWQGHGTHVAGIVAGNLPEGAKQQFQMDSLGIAPEAQLIIMNVFDMNGECYMDYLIAAMEDCIMLGVDCANLSLGVPSGPVYFDDVTEVFDAAYEAGINVVTSAGNDGHTGINSLWGNDMVRSDSVSTGTVGMPGTFDSVLTVASADNSHIMNTNGDVMSWYNEMEATYMYVVYTEVTGVPEGKTFREQLKGQSFDYTDSLEDAQGKLVFCPFQGGSADDLIVQASQAGAAGLILVGRDPAEDNGWSIVEATATRFDVPTCVSFENQYRFLLNNNPDAEQLRVDETWNPARTAGQISSYSSWGPTEGLTLKPEITGIGGSVFSAYLMNQFAVMSGTSMASPAVAASAALVRQYLRENELVAEEELTYVVNCLLMSTATPVFDEEHGTYYFVRRQGAGLANIGAAIASGAYITVDGTNKAKLELGDDPDRAGVYEMTFEVVNFSDVDKTYTLDTTVLGQKAEGGQFRNGEVTYLTVDYARNLAYTYTTNLREDTITVPANAKANVTVTVQLTDTEKAYYDERFPVGAYVEGFVRLLSDETPNLTVPFLAFYGEFDDASVFEAGDYVNLLGGSKSYNMADQYHNSIWGQTPLGIGDFVENRYLGDTFNPMFDLVAPEDYESGLFNYMIFSPQTAGFSPNDDGVLDVFEYRLGLRRNADNIHYTVTNVKTGEILWEQDTGFVQKTYNVNRFVAALAWDWLYPVKDYGEFISYDWDTCLLENDTWVELRADVTPEGAAEATESRVFTVYIDTDAPYKDKDFTLRADPNGALALELNHYEQWFLDYTLETSYYYNEELGVWEGYSLMYGYLPGSEPLNRNRIYTETYFYQFDKNVKFSTFTYDYAGNVAAFELSGEKLLDYVDLRAEKARVMEGDTLTITDIGDAHFTKKLSWSVSDPDIAEIVESTDSTVTIRGLCRGTVTVYGGWGEYTKGIDITVTNPDFEALRTKFVDVPGHWAEEEILEAVYRGLFKGMDDTHFAPNANLTRAELVTVLYRMAGEPSVESMTHPFADIAADTWYTDAVIWAYNAEVVNGVSDTAFAPAANITREQIAAILFRFSGAEAVEADHLVDFADAGKVSAYAIDAMNWAVANGLINGMGDGTLAPQGNATRAQIATILMRYCETIAE